MIPNWPAAKTDTNLGVRGFGEKMFIQIIAPGFEIDRDLQKKFNYFCEHFDYVNHALYGPIYHLMAYWAQKAKEIQT